MALVPYRVAGAAADQRADVRLLQLPGGVTLRLHQWAALSGAGPPPAVLAAAVAATVHAASGAAPGAAGLPAGKAQACGAAESAAGSAVTASEVLAVAASAVGARGGLGLGMQPGVRGLGGSSLDTSHSHGHHAAAAAATAAGHQRLDTAETAPGASTGAPPATSPAAAAAATNAATAAPGSGAAPMEWSGPPLSSLANVGLVVWQAGYLLAEHLLRTAPLDPRSPHCWLRASAGRRCARLAVRSAAAAGAADAAAAAAAAPAGATAGWEVVDVDLSSWRGVAVVDLGTGPGTVGLALAAAGADVALTDLPHVLPLAAANLAANRDPNSQLLGPGGGRAAVVPYSWGEDPAAAAAPPLAVAAGGAASDGPGGGWLCAPAPLAALVAAGTAAGGGGDIGCAGGAAASAADVAAAAGCGAVPSDGPDLITAADVLYHPELLPALVGALQRLAAPHTVAYVSFRCGPRVRAGWRAPRRMGLGGWLGGRRLRFVMGAQPLRCSWRLGAACSRLNRIQQC